MQIQLKHTHKQTHTHAHNYRKLAIVATGNLWQFIANLWQIRNALFAIAFVIQLKVNFRSSSNSLFIQSILSALMPTGKGEGVQGWWGGRECSQ